MIVYKNYVFEEFLMTWEKFLWYDIKRKKNTKLYIGKDFNFVETNHRQANYTCPGEGDREDS